MTGVVELSEGVEMVMPGDNVTFTVDLIKPIAMEEGLQIRHPRGWPHRRRWRRHQDRGVSEMVAPKIRIKLRGFDHKALDQSASKIVDTVRRTGADVSGPVPLPTRIRRFCVLRSPFIDKDSQEHFEIRTHNRLVDIMNSHQEDHRLADDA